MYITREVVNTKGDGTCPVTTHMIPCNYGHPSNPTDKCEWWDEYVFDCAINLVVRELRKLNKENVD